MPRIQRLIVVTKEQTNTFTNAGYIKYLYESVDPIRSKYPDKFQIYTTKADRKLLIHSKIVIIDDVYLSIGSANWNRRSMTADSELNAEVVDTETVGGFDSGKIASRFPYPKVRRDDESELQRVECHDDCRSGRPICSCDSQQVDNPRQVGDRVSPYYIAITDLMRKVSDPQFTCTTDDN